MLKQKNIFFLLARKRNYLIIGFLLLFLAWPNISFLRADDYSSSHFISRDPVISIEGGISTSANFENLSSIGQFATGENTSTNFTQTAGFLYFSTEASVPETNQQQGGGGGSYAASIISYFLPKILTVTPTLLLKDVDLNGDGKVDIVDLSIFLYYDSQPYSARYDFNKDGSVDIVDISILLFYWV